MYQSSRGRIQIILNVNGSYENETDAHLLNKIIFLDLNKLPDEPHNAFIKCFASHKKQKTAAFKTLTRIGLDLFSNQVRWIVQGLSRLWLHLKGENQMGLADIEVTPESLIEFGKLWGDDLIKNSPIEKRLEGIPPQVLEAYLDKLNKKRSV